MKRSLRNYIKTITIMATTIVAIFVGSNVAFGTGNPFYIVSSGSMIPVLHVGDVIMVQENAPFDKTKVGDIIAFFSPTDHSEVIVHRVAQILTQDPFEVRTKGDANPNSIQGIDLPITKYDYVGKVAYVIPQVGYLAFILNPPVNYVMAISIMGIMGTMATKSSDIQKRKNLLADDSFKKMSAP